MERIPAPRSRQLDLFDHVAGAYVSIEGALDNDHLYKSVAESAGIEVNEMTVKKPVGRAGQECNLLKRSIRWHQQTLKHLGFIEHVAGERGLWRLTNEGKQRLRQAKPDVALLAFSTDLGIAIFANCNRVFPHLDVPIHLVVTSPPNPLCCSSVWNSDSSSVLSILTHLNAVTQYAEDGDGDGELSSAPIPV